MHENELTHYGVKGMKWGVTKKREPLASYTAKQRKQDRSIYGRGSERRIEKRMRKGEGIKSARHREMVRKDRIRRAKSFGKKVAVTSFTVAGAALVTKMLQNTEFGSKIPETMLGSAVSEIGESFIRNLIGR